MMDIISSALSKASSRKKRLPKPLLSSPTKSNTIGRCAALDASKTVCNNPTKQGMMWCPRHNEERVKLYVNYKKHHTALDTFPEDGVCRDEEEVMGCCSLDILQEWNKILIAKYRLLTR
jgi:hypothetical protein